MNNYDSLLKKYRTYTIISLGIAIALWEFVAVFIVRNSFIAKFC